MISTHGAIRRAPSRMTVLAVSSIGGFMAFVDATIVNVAFPDVQATFSAATTADVSWILNAYNIVFAALLVAAGRFADLLGRRRVYTSALMVFTVASVLCAIAPDLGWLVGFRVAQAVGAAFLVPSSLALVLQAYTKAERPKAAAAVAAVSALAAGIGPALGGLLVSVGSWRLVFLVNVPIGVAGYVLARRLLVEGRQPGRRRLPDVPGAAVFAVAVAGLVLAMLKGEEWGWGSPATVGTLVLAVGCAGLLVRRCQRHRSPVVDPTLLRRRSYAVTLVAAVVAAAGFFGYTLLNVLYLTEVWGYTVAQAGFAITPGPLVAIVTAVAAGRAVERVGMRPVLVAGGLFWAAAVVYFVVRIGPVPTVQTLIADWLPGMVLLGVGAGTLFPSLSAAAVAAVDGERFATTTGLNNVARQVGAALGVAAVVAVVGAVDRRDPAAVLAAFDRGWSLCAVCLAVGGLLCIGVGRLAGGTAGSTAKTGGAPPSAVARPLLAPGVPERVQRVREPVREGAVDFLARVSIFADLDPDLRAKIAREASVVRLRAGGWLFRGGATADALYVVRSGRLDVVDEAASTVLRVVGRGAVLGELALLTGGIRSASVRAARTSELLQVRRAEFDELLASVPAVSAALTRTLAERLRDGAAPTTAGRAVPASIALVAVDGRPPVAALAEHLAAELGRWGSVARLDRHSVTPAVDAEAAYAPVLDRALEGYDTVLLIVDGVTARDPWAGFCMRQADRILVIAAPGGTVDVTRHPELRGCDLVGWNVDAGSGELTGLAEKLEPVESHAIATRSAIADVARLARRLAGRSVGVVLSGGGARAFAHLGVLEELSAAGVVIDRVGGTSMGAFIGAMFAMGMDIAEIDACCYEEWVRRRPLADYTLPRHSLIRGDRCRALFRRCFGDVSVEELRRSFFSTATELRSGGVVVFRHGPLRDAVGASMALPVLAPPLLRGREILVDGGLADNLPVSVMAALGEGPVIAVDCRATIERPVGSGPVRAPALGEVLGRVLSLGSTDTRESARRHADWTIEPVDTGIGLLEFHQIDAARAAGRAAVRAALSDAPHRILPQLDAGRPS
ncbi:MDR family MFS transporter/patatin-like phospholipase family protein [Actinomycetes bacterium KLBMP 9759]